MRNFYAKFKGVIGTLVVASMLFASCAVEYDDTALRQEIADLYEKVSKLEDRLDEEVATLKTLIDSKTVVASATKNQDGSWDILLTSGEKITVYPKYVPDAQAPEVNEGCITVVKEGDVYYWAQIVDGKAVAIVDGAGNKIPVAHPQQDIPEQHPAPQLQVNPTTGDVELSVDGGKTWVVVEKAEQESEEPVSTCIFTGVVDGETSVDFLLASGEVISVPKAEAIDFGVQAGKTFVTPGQSVDVALKAENIDDLTVIAKPEGWKATISGKTLTVTAPAQEKIDAGEAELDGLVKIHAAGGDGKCMVGKLAVSASTATIVLEIAGDNLTIYNNATNSWGDIAPAYYGLMPQSEFSAAAIAAGMNDYTLNMLYSYEPQVTVSLKEVYNMMQGNYEPASYVDIPTGQSYVLWAVSEGQGTWYEPYVYTETDVLFSVFTPAFLDVEVTKVTFNTVEFTAAAGGYSGYIVGVISGNDEAELKAQLENAFDNWKVGYGEFGETVYELNYKGNVLDFPGSTLWGGIYPNTSYMIYILPLVDGKTSADYLASDLKTFTYTTSNIEAGGSATLTFEPLEVAYTSLEVAIKGSENTSMIYSWFATAEELAQYKNDEELLQYVIQFNTEYQQMAMGNESLAYISSLNPGDTATLCAFAVDADGKYGALYKQEFKTNVLAYNEAMKVVIDAAASKVDITSANIKVAVEGGTAVSYRYLCVGKTSYNWKGEETAESQLALDTNWNVNTVAAADLVDGCINVTDLTTGTEYAFAVIAVDEAGTPSRASYYYFTPTLPEYPIIRATNEAYAAMKPAVEVVPAWDSYYGRFDVNVTITPAAGTAKYWVAVWDNESAVGPDSPAKDVIDQLLLKEGAYYGSIAGTEAGTLTPNDRYGHTYDVNAVVYIAWMDEAGNYYEAIQAPVFTTPYVASTEASWTASEPTVTAELVAGEDGLKTLTYTVTPGAGATEMYILAAPQRFYYDDDTFTYALTLHQDAVKATAEYSGTLAGVPEEATVAVSWKDAAGNLYQVKKTLLP